VLLSDTVGFIRDLPHRLITSFKATLEEARQADLLLHVADASHPAVCDQISAVFAVLQELGIEAKEALLVVNKIDRLPSVNALNGLLNRYPNAIPISARTGLGFERLAFAVSDALSRSFCDVDVETGVDNGRLMAYLAAHGEVLSQCFDDSRATIHCRLPRKYVAQITGSDTQVRFRDGAAPAAIEDVA
jgi:GTPase